MKTESLQNPLLTRRPRKDLDGTSSENPSDRLVKLMQDVAKSVTETSSKVRKPKTYNEAINNPINGNR